MEEEVKGLGDYLDIVRRHKYLVLIPALILMAITVSVAYLLPATYKSEGRILIESQEIPRDLIKSTVTSYADQRIAVIKQRIMTTTKVMEMVKKHNLYPDMKNKSQTSEYVAAFKQNMNVKMVSANVTDPNSGRARRASIAFRVSFMDKSPKKAQQVANDLVTEFLSENVKTRTDRAAETKDFLEEEGNKFQRKIQLIEQNIAEFKDKNSDSLPELLQYNLSMVDRLEQELGENQNQLTLLQDQVMTMSLELVNINPYLEGRDINRARGESSSAEQQLAQATLQYNRLLSKYSANHPDVMRLKRQIKSLEDELGVQSSQYEKLAKELKAAKASLSESQLRYSESHPDVKAQVKRVAELEAKLGALPVPSSTSTVSTQAKKQAMNPVYLQIKSKIDSTEREIARLKERRIQAEKKLADYEERVFKTHQVKRAYNDLSRDHASNLAKYKELRAKQLEAELAQNLESENKGESFTLLEPPQVPSKAEKPNRPKIVAMGSVASIGFGLGLAFLFEMFFGGVRGYKQVTHVLGTPPLVVVPMINTIEDFKVRKKGYKRIAIFVFLLLCALVAAVHFLYMDLEVIWHQVMRKISML